MSKVAYNTQPTIHSELLNNGDLLIISDKVKIVHENGDITGLCLDLRHYYSRGGGFIERKVRSDKEVVQLGQEWARKYIN